MTSAREPIIAVNNIGEPVPEARTPGCISGCTQHGDGLFHHHPYCRTYGASSPNAAILHQAVLDHGFVRYVEHMGDDTAIVDAARTSYQKGTKRVRGDRDLIRYLMRHRHSTPIEMAELKLHVKAPISVMRQWQRHRTFSFNEVSTRYSDVSQTDVYRPAEFRAQSRSNRQGSEGLVEHVLPEQLRNEYDAVVDRSRLAYRNLLHVGNAREQAREILVLATYTEVYVKTDLWNWLRFLELRTDAHAQLEIRQFAEAVERIVAELFPWTYEAWLDYVKHAVTFSRKELAWLTEKIGLVPELEELQHAGLDMSKRELTEFRQKLVENFGWRERDDVR